MSLTQIIIIIFVILIGGVDLLLYAFRGDDATISRTLLKVGKAWPIIPFLFGVLMGHIFWTNCGERGSGGSKSPAGPSRAH